MGVPSNLMPHECRVRDLSYSAPILVDFRYTKGNHIQPRTNFQIGRMPIMLGSSNCWLSEKNNEELSQIRECPYDPRGYFIVRGVEKVLMI
jgi:DNA-directed RNA polymerase III subunit RPC2